MSTPTFERDRINFLRNERIISQKKTFTKWINSFLIKVNLQVIDLFTDLGDGKILIKLLEVISGETIGPPARGKLRLHNIESVSRALTFLQRHVNLVGVGPADIVDGNEQLILGLIWVIILRFQIADISIEDDGSSENRSAKEALLVWCQRKTKGYAGVDIHNFSTSWKNGLAFNALIHKHRPDLVSYESLRPNNSDFNLHNAFDVAWQHLGITKLLDVEDVNCVRPDDKSVMTYVSAFYHYFAKMKVEETGGRRIAKIVDVIMTIDEMKREYERLVTNLLEWITLKISELREDFTRTLPAVQQEMLAFKKFRTVEKPSKNTERVNIEVHLFALNTKIEANQQRRYEVPCGKLVSDVNQAWEVMERAEHARGTALRHELLRQEKLRTLAEKFHRKANLRESWLDDMRGVLAQEESGDEISMADSILKRHEAISHDIQARECRFNNLFSMVQQLRQEHYHEIGVVEQREKEILIKWTKLNENVALRHQKLLELNKLVGIFRDIEDVKADLEGLLVSVKSNDYGKHLQDVESLIEKHSLIKSELTTRAERLKKIDENYESLNQSQYPQKELLKKHFVSLKALFQEVSIMSKERETNLDQSRRFHVFCEQWEETEMFIKDKEKEAASKDVGKDLISLTRLLKKHQDLASTLRKYEATCDVVCSKGERMIEEGHCMTQDIQMKVKLLRSNFTSLVELVEVRGERLKDAVQSLQYYSDANDAESWMKEKLVVVSSEDLGRDEQSAQSLLQRHVYVHDEIKAFQDDIKKLDEQSGLMSEASVKERCDNNMANQMSNHQEEMYETFFEETEVETDEEVDEVVEKEVTKNVVKEVKIPQAKALYSYTGSGVSLVKGERALAVKELKTIALSLSQLQSTFNKLLSKHKTVVYVLAKSNKDWWNVRRQTSRESGYVPANYVKEIEPRIIQKMAKETVLVPEVIKGKRKVKKKVQIEKKRLIETKRKAPFSSASLLRNRNKARGAVKRHFTGHFDRDNAATRQLTLGNMYRKLLELSEIRRENLQFSQKYFRFCHDSEELQSWINRKETWLKNVVMSNEQEYFTIKNHLEKFRGEMEVNACRLEVTRNLVQELMLSEREDNEDIEEQQDRLTTRWRDLGVLLQLKVDELDEKHGVQLFNNSCEELLSWMNVKESVLSEDIQGGDLETVRKLQRKHQVFERELTSIQTKFDTLEKQAKSLIQSHSGQTRQIRNKEQAMKTRLASLKDKASLRRNFLNEAYGKQGFLADARQLLTWSSEKYRLLEMRQEAKDLTSVQKMMDDHKASWEDIESYEYRFDQLIKYGKDLLKQKPQSDEIRSQVTRLQGEYEKLTDEWKKRERELIENYDLLVFIRDAERINTTCSSQISYLSNAAIGDSLAEVESLLRKQNDFEKTLEAQEDKVHSLENMADYLVSSGHYDAARIKERKEHVMAKRRDVQRLTKERRQRLLDAKVLQQFIWNANEFVSWTNERLAVARDQSYHEPANVENKILKHQTFEAEICANEPEYQRLLDDGQELISKEHVGCGVVSNKISECRELWEELLAVCCEKTSKLSQVAEHRRLNQTLEDEKLWLNDVETLLSSADVGETLVDTKFLLKKQQDTENEMNIHERTLEMMLGKCSQLTDADRIIQDITAFSTRLCQVSEICSARRAQHEESLLFHQFVRDVEDELATIWEHSHKVSSKELGTSYIGVQKLQRRHQALESEVGNLEKRIEDILGIGQNLIDGVHFASDQIEELCDGLTGAWDDLLAKCNDRREMLADAAESHRYFSEANEADCWMNEKAGLASSQDYGKDEKSVQKLITKHNCLITDVESYGSVIEDFAKEARRLIEAEHFDFASIKARQLDVEEQYLGLKTLVAVRQNKLVEASKLYEFLREVDELADWINDQVPIASSEDYGQDFEHLQEIQMKFEDFKETVSLNAESYHRVDKFAKTLVADGHTDTVTIKDHQDIIRAMWRQLHDHISSRSERLQNAAEIHKFTNDLDDLLDRIDEKDHKLDVQDEADGKDTGSIEALQRKHEVFEHELQPMELDVLALLDEARRLKEAYKGQTADVIQDHEDLVVKNWQELQEKSRNRQKRLEDSLKLHLLNNSIRDVKSWCTDVTSAMATEEVADDITSAECLLSRHGERKVEIESREEIFSLIIARGQEMIETGHYSAEEITDKLELLLRERDELHESWTQYQSHYDQMYELAVFMKEVKQVDTVINSQEVILASGELGSSVDEVSSLLRRHENLEKLVLAQDEKLESLAELCENLTNHEHFAEDTMKDKIWILCERQGRLHTLVEQRRGKLEDAQKLLLFYQDIVELNSWITEKIQTVSDECYKDARNLEHKLKKHSTFRAELTAHDDAINDVMGRGQALLTSAHYAHDDIAHRLETLQTRWQGLLHVSQLKGERLEQARDIVKFDQQVQNVEFLIEEKESIVSSDEIGQDYEQCLMLNRKSETFLKETQVESEQVKTLNVLAGKLISRDHVDAVTQERLGRVNERWEKVKDRSAERKTLLENALQVFAFLKSCDELCDNINEKGALATMDENYKDVAGVEWLLRKHDDLERSVIILNESLEKLKLEGETLKMVNSEKKHALDMKLTEMMENFARVNELVVQRRTTLEENKLLLIFLSGHEDLLIWLLDFVQRLNPEEEESKNLKATEEALRVHEERKRMLEAHQDQFNHCVEFGSDLLNNDHFASAQIVENVDELRETWLNVEQFWQDRKTLLAQNLHLQRYLADVNQFGKWIEAKECLVLNDDLGHSLEAVEDLLKEHTILQNAIDAYEEQLTRLTDISELLLKDASYDEQLVKREGIIMSEKWKGLKHACLEKRKKLEQSKLLQQFLQDADEVQLWMKSKCQITTDTSYLERFNLQIMKKHNAFEADLAANKKRLENAVVEGKCLVQDGHFASSLVEDKIEEMQKMWNELNRDCEERGIRLHQVFEKKTFDLSVQDLQDWITNTAQVLSSEDLGRDLNSVKILIRKQDRLEAEIMARGERILDISSKVDDFLETNHFQKDEIQDTAREVIERFHSLAEPAMLRSSALQQSLSLHQFLRDVQDHVRWLREKQRIVSSDELGRDLSGAETLTRKHEILEGEVSVRDGLVRTVQDTGERLVDEGHYASGEINENCDTLKESWENLVQGLHDRKKMLCDSLAVQKYNRDVFDTVLLIEGKLSVVASEDFGQCQESAEELLRIHETSHLDVQGLESKLQDLQVISQTMIDQGHFDCVAISEKQKRLERKYEELKHNMETRQHMLEDSVTWHHFARDTAELRDWMMDKHHMTSSEDCGKDLEHAQLLLKKFEDFARDLVTSEDRVVEHNDLGRELIDAGHCDAEAIEMTMAEINEDWDKLKTRTRMRLRTLEESCDLRSFENNVEDMTSRIEEKREILRYNEGYLSKDSSSVQRLMKKHEELERDVEVLQGKLTDMHHEGKLLSEAVPAHSLHVQTLLIDLNNLLQKLASDVQERRDNLTQALDLQQFLSEVKNMSSWVITMTSQMTLQDSLQDDITTMLSRHHEYQTELNAMLKNFKTLEQNGDLLITKGHYASDVILAGLQDLGACWDTLLSTWEARDAQLEERKTAEQLDREMRQLESWLTAQETELECSDVVCNTLEHVDEMLKKHDELERTMVAQEERFLGLVVLPQDGRFTFQNDDKDDGDDRIIDNDHNIDDGDEDHNIDNGDDHNIDDGDDHNIDDGDDHNIDDGDEDHNIDNGDDHNIDDGDEDHNIDNGDDHNIDDGDDHNIDDGDDYNINGRDRENNDDHGIDDDDNRMKDYNDHNSDDDQARENNDYYDDHSIDGHDNIIDDDNPVKDYDNHSSDEDQASKDDNDDFDDHYIKDYDDYSLDNDQVRDDNGHLGGSRNFLTLETPKIIITDANSNIDVTFSDEETDLPVAISDEDDYYEPVSTHHKDSDFTVPLSDDDHHEEEHPICPKELDLTTISLDEHEFYEDDENLPPTYNKDLDLPVSLSDDDYYENDEDLPPMNQKDSVFTISLSDREDFPIQPPNHKHSELPKPLSDDKFYEDKVHPVPPIYHKDNDMPLSDDEDFPIQPTNHKHSELPKPLSDDKFYKDKVHPVPLIYHKDNDMPLSDDEDMTLSYALQDFENINCNDLEIRSTDNELPPAPSTLPSPIVTPQPPPPLFTTPPNLPPYPTHKTDLDFPFDLPLPPPPPPAPEDDQNLPDMLDFIPPPVLDDSFHFLLETSENNEVVQSESIEAASPSGLYRVPPPPENELPAKHTMNVPQRPAPPPPPRPSISLLSEMELHTLHQAHKHHGKKEERKGIFGGIFKRKK